jgi:diaminopimelate epimerase
MDVEFHKMQGAGNDFIVLDERIRPLGLTPERVALLADRRLGIGCDQLILLQPAPEPDGDAFVRFFNSDGSESGACGNGTRCAAALVASQTGRDTVRLSGPAGPLPAEILGGGQVRVDLGPARFGWRDVPLSREIDTLHLGPEGGIAGDPAACSMGNPHATLFVEDLDRIEVVRNGATLERHALFPERANIGFVQLRSRERIRLMVWERGAGLTPACGSGACAAVVNAHRRGLVGRSCAVEMPGGLLHVTWREDGHVLLAGPTATVFTGHVRLAS